MPRPGISNGNGIKVDESSIPNCKDPELAKWILQLMKESNLELQAMMDMRMQEVLRSLNNQKRASRPRPPPGKPPPMPPGRPSKHGSSHNLGEQKSSNKASEDTVQPQPQPQPQQEVAAERSSVTSSEPPKSPGMLSCLFDSYSQQNPVLYDENAKLTGLHWFMRMPIDVLAGLVIALNTVVVFVQLDWKGYLINVEYDQADPGGWMHAGSVFDFLEHVFCTIFLSELILRLWYFRCHFFKDKLNVLDAVVVVTTSIYTFVLSRVQAGNSRNMGFFRLFRYVKLVRGLRFIRAMQLCHQLRVLIRTILSSFGSLLWSMVILCAFMLMAALFLCQTLQDFIVANRDNPTSDIGTWCNRNYGTASKALWTMFEITFSGGWPTWTRRLIEEVSPWYAIFFALYVGGVVFAVIRIITALFLKETLAVAANDAEMMMQQKLKEKEKFCRKLEEVFMAADASGDGMVSWQEFKELIDNPKAKVTLAGLELETHEMESLFNLLDDGDGNVSFDEFLQGVVRLKGQARSQDVLAILHDSRKVLNKVSSLERCVKLMMLEMDMEVIEEHSAMNSVGTAPQLADLTDGGDNGSVALDAAAADGGGL